MIITILGFTASAIISALLIKHETSKSESISVSGVNYNHLCNNIELLNSLKTELQNTENLIIDIEMYSESDLTNITVSNNKYNCSVLVNNKSDLLKSLYKHRDFLRNEITSLLSEMTVNNNNRCNVNVTQTINESVNL